MRDFYPHPSHLLDMSHNEPSTHEMWIRRDFTGNVDVAVYLTDELTVSVFRLRTDLDCSSEQRLGIPKPNTII